jgi:hypothetical protein
LLQSNLERRAALTGDRMCFRGCPTCRWCCRPITGKVEMVYEGEQQGAEVVARKLIGLALGKLFETTFPAVERAGTAQRTERERRGYGDIDPDDLDDAFVGRRLEKERTSARASQTGCSEPSPHTRPSWRGSPRATASQSPTSSRLQNTFAS